MAGVQGLRVSELQESGKKAQGHWCSWAIKTTEEKKDFKPVKMFFISQFCPGLQWHREDPLMQGCGTGTAPSQEETAPLSSLVTLYLPCVTCHHFALQSSSCTFVLLQGQRVGLSLCLSFPSPSTPCPRAWAVALVSPINVHQMHKGSTYKKKGKYLM